MKEYSQYYIALGLEPGASLDEVKEAYADSAKVWDPTRYQGEPRLHEKALLKQRELKEAYEKLLVLLLEPVSPPVPVTSLDGSKTAVPGEVSLPPIPELSQEEIDQQTVVEEVSGDPLPPLPVDEGQAPLPSAKAGVSNEAKLVLTLMGIVSIIILFNAIFTEQKPRSGEGSTTLALPEAEEPPVTNRGDIDVGTSSEDVGDLLGESNRTEDGIELGALAPELLEPGPASGGYVTYEGPGIGGPSKFVRDPNPNYSPASSWKHTTKPDPGPDIHQAPDPVYPDVVLKDGSRLKGILQKYENGLAYVLLERRDLARPVLSTLPEDLVDKQATEESQRRLRTQSQPQQ